MQPYQNWCRRSIKNILSSGVIIMIIILSTFYKKEVIWLSQLMNGRATITCHEQSDAMVKSYYGLVLCMMWELYVALNGSHRKPHLSVDGWENITITIIIRTFISKYTEHTRLSLPEANIPSSFSTNLHWCVCSDQSSLQSSCCWHTPGLRS
jgi:hypothetical protein